MKRDMDLIRSILLQVEATDDPQEWIDPEVEGRSELEVSYHVMLMDQGGLLEAMDRSAIGIFRWSARRLTWRGHEFLDAARQEGRWRDCLLAAGGDGSVNLEVLEGLLVEAAAQPGPRTV